MSKHEDENRPEETTDATSGDGDPDHPDVELPKALRETGHEPAPEPSTVTTPSGERVPQPAGDESETTDPHVRTADRPAAAPRRPGPPNQASEPDVDDDAGREGDRSAGNRDADAGGH